MDLDAIQTSRHSAVYGSQCVGLLLRREVRCQILFARMKAQPVENDLLEIAARAAVENFELAGIHLRDARFLIQTDAQLRDNRALSKAAILMACAALESNLTFLSHITLQLSAARQGVLHDPQLEFLRAEEAQIDDNGQIVKRRARQSLSHRMTVVPRLMARLVDRRFLVPARTSWKKKLERTITRRDAIVHPRWDRYLPQSSWWHAAEAVDAVELYLKSVSDQLSPYVVGYVPLLMTIRGPHKDDVGIGYRTRGRRAPTADITSMADVSATEILLADWLDAAFMINLARSHGTEADSDGSMLTRAALVLLYSMLDAHLAVVSQWKMQENPSRFADVETLFLSEVGVGIDHDGEIWSDTDQQPFKKRVRAVPTVLARCTEGKELSVNLGGKVGQALLNGYALRNRVIHSSPGERMPRVSKSELTSAVDAVLGYFDDLASKAPQTFGYWSIISRNRERLI